MYSMDTKKLLGRLFLVLSAVHIVLYAVYHLSYVFILNEYGAAFAYAALYLDKAKNILLPVFIGTVSLATYAYHGSKKSALYAFVLSLSTLIYSFPYYYIICIGYGNDTTESLILTLPISLGITLLTFLLSILVTAVGRFYVKRNLKKNKKNASVSETLREGLPEASGYDLSTPVGKALFFISFIPFLLQFVAETVDAISFFTEEGWGYEIGEALLILFNYVFILAVFFSAVAIANLTKKVLIKRV